MKLMLILAHHNLIHRHSIPDYIGYSYKVTEFLFPAEIRHLLLNWHPVHDFAHSGPEKSFTDRL